MSVSFSVNLPPLRETRNVASSEHISLSASNRGIELNSEYSGSMAASPLLFTSRTGHCRPCFCLSILTLIIGGLPASA